MKKINLLILHSNILGGSTQFLLNDLKLLGKDKTLDIYIGLIGKGNNVRLGTSDSSIFYIKRSYYNPRTFFELVKFVREEKIDLVHLNSPATYFIGPILKLFKNIKLIVYLHGDLKYDVKDNFIKRAIRKYLFSNFIDRFIVVSNDLGNVLISDYKIKEDKIRVIYNGAPDLSKIKINKEFVSNLNKRYSLKDKFVILNIGRLVDVKNQRMLISLGKRLKNKINYKILIAGDGPLKSNLQEEINKNNLQRNIFLLGEIKHNEINSLLSVSDAFVLTSNYEGISISVLEAMSMSVPCILSNVGGNKEILKEFKRNLLFDLNNLNDLTKKIMNLNKNHKLIKELSNKLR